jgi:phage tail sheath protein FI
MAETLISPGVLARENDQSFLTQQPVTVGAAIIGPAVKGPVEVPTLVTSYTDYLNKFGGAFLSGGQEYSYFTSITAYNYFQQGGETMLVTRVASGSFTSATVTGGAISGSNTSGSFTLKTISEGTIMNNSGSLGTNGTLSSGSSDNIRWQIVSPDTSSGTFTLLVRQGNDTTTEPIVLETWSGVSLDPTQPNYIARVIGDSYKALTIDSDGVAYVQEVGTFTNQSRYVYVSEVQQLTPNYFDNNGTAKDIYTGSIPVAASGTFTGATGDLFYGGNASYYQNVSGSTNLQGITANDYTASIALMANQDDYRYNVLVAPGLTIEDNATQAALLVNTVQGRGDAIAVVDSATYGAPLSTATNSAANINSSYAATYWPWLQTLDPGTGQLAWVPASVMIPAVYAFNDSVSEPWFAPAGINRGGLDTVVRAERKLTQSQRNDLYVGNVNPIATFPGTGVVVYGQKTLQKKASALDRVNVRRLLIQLKSYISQVANNLVFEQNTIATRNQFLSQVNPYLESVQQRQGLYAFRVIMDDSNNTPDVIDRNQLVGQIYLQPTKTAEFIYLDFNVLPTGATFPA